MSDVSTIRDPELKGVVDEIKRTIDPRQYLTPAKKNTYVCPFCGSGTGKHGTGMQYKPEQNAMFCSRCTRPYDAIAIYQQVHGATFGEAVHELSSGKSRKVVTKPVPLSAKKEPAKDFTSYYAECRKRLTDPRAVKYLEGRGISVETARAFGWGFDPAADPAETGKYFTPRLILASTKGHYVGRRIDGVEDYDKINAKGSTAGVTNLHVMDVPGQVFVCEGAFSAASVYEAGGGLPVILNSAGNAGIFLDYGEAHRPQALLLLALDDDDAGHEATTKITKKLAELKIPYRVAHGLAEGEKDSNDLWIENSERFRKRVQMAMNPEGKKEYVPFDGFFERIMGDRYKAVKTGIDELDDLMGGGFVPGKLILIGAAPGKAKTAICQWICETMAERNKDMKALFISLEMSRDELEARSLSRMIFEHVIGDLSAMEILQHEDVDAMQSGIDKYLSLIGNRVQYNLGCDGVNFHPRGLDEILKTVNMAGDVNLLVVDYIQLIDSGDQTEMERIGKSMKYLLHYARSKNCIVIAVMANNRASNQTGNSSMFTGRGSSDLEYSADYILNITSDEDDSKRFLTLAKGRLAEAGRSIEFRFDGRHMRVHSMELPLGKDVTRKESKAINDLLGLEVDTSSLKKKK